MDWNKRIAYFLTRLILLNHEVDISASQDEKYEMTVAASTGELRIEEIKKWIEEKLTDKY